MANADRVSQPTEVSREEVKVERVRSLNSVMSGDSSDGSDSDSDSECGDDGFC